jgi:dienelactone hydrolase
MLKDVTEWGKLDIPGPGLISRNNKQIREPEIFDYVRALRSKYKKIAAIGFSLCGWAVFRLRAKGNNHVDCISTAHPTWLEKDEISNVGVPVQMLAPERDPSFHPDLKKFASEVIPTLGVAYDHQYFPGVEHAFATRGDERDEMERTKNAAVGWFQLWFHLQ